MKDKKESLIIDVTKFAVSEKELNRQYYYADRISKKQLLLKIIGEQHPYFVFNINLQFFFDKEKEYCIHNRGIVIYFNPTNNCQVMSIAGIHQLLFLAEFNAINKSKQKEFINEIISNLFLFMFDSFGLPLKLQIMIDYQAAYHKQVTELFDLKFFQNYTSTNQSSMVMAMMLIDKNLLPEKLKELYQSDNEDDDYEDVNYEDDDY